MVTDRVGEENTRTNACVAAEFRTRGKVPGVTSDDGIQEAIGVKKGVASQCDEARRGIRSRWQMSPAAFVVPATSRRANGLVVPMPTLPELSIVMRSVLDVPRVNGTAPPEPR